MGLVDRGGRWHATIPKKGNRWIDMPDLALNKLADLLEFPKIPQDAATNIRHAIDKGRVPEAQEYAQKFMDDFPFDEIIAQEDERVWNDKDGNPVDQGPVGKIYEALQTFVDADPAAFESGAQEEEPDDSPEAEPEPVVEPSDSDNKSAADDFSKQVDAARAAIEALKNSGLTPEQVKAVDRALKEINDLVAEASKGGKPAKEDDSEEQPAEEQDSERDTGIAVPYDSSDEIRDSAEAEDKPEEEKPGPRHRAEDPAEEAGPDAEAEIASVAKLKEAFENGYSTADEHIWQGKRGSVEIGTLADGTKVVRKKAPNEEEADKEALIGLVANVLGVDVFTAKVGKTELVTHHIKGSTGNEWLREQYNDPDAPGGKTEKIKPWRQAGAAEIKAVREMKNAKEMGLLDFLVQNPDRHAGNWMVREGDEIVPIDHGNAKFEPKKFSRDGQEMVWFNGSPFMKYWLGMEVGKYKEIKSMNPGKHWDEAELKQLRSKLAGLKDEFASRPEWHDAIMGNIDNVLENIK